MITSGSVSSVRIGLTIVFAIASTAAPSRSGHQPPIETPLKIQSATASASDVRDPREDEEERAFGR